MKEKVDNISYTAKAMLDRKISKNPQWYKYMVDDERLLSVVVSSPEGEGSR